VIEVDASYGEGGGQLVRTAVALSAISGKAVQLVNVRAGRARPGLAPQHLAAVRAVAALCDASCEGLELRSTHLRFSPGTRPAGGELAVDVGTAGSVTLVLQALVPVLLAAPKATRVVVRGGTDVRQAPSWDYFCRVLLPLLARMRLRVHASVARRGYYPRGGGEVAVEVEPGVPEPLVLRLARGPWRIAGEAHVANLPVTIAERMGSAAAAALGRDAPIETRLLGRAEAIGTGGAVTLCAQSDTALLGASRVAERGVRAETLGEAVGSELAADLQSGATLDVHAADQVLVYAAMAKGESRFAARAVSSHARTAMWLIPKFLPARFPVAEKDGLAHVRVEGGQLERS
jgi:RNA 3'-terminal phosphate cyclase (ATP)